MNVYVAPMIKCGNVYVAPMMQGNNGAMVNVGSYIKNEHGYGFGCQPEWLYVDRRPCS